MTPIQQLMLGVGAKKKVYMDDVFSTFLYNGNGSTRSINNGIDLSGEGGLTWLKRRDGGVSHRLFDTVRGATKEIYTNLNSAESTDNAALTSFNNNGFSLGTSGGVNDGNDTFASWTFRKAKGFFDIVTWTGNNSNSRQISHSLGCVPGCIMIKRLNHSADWRVYHRGLNGGVDPYDSILVLNSSAAENDAYDNLLKSVPTATTFTLGDNSDVNASSGTYVAYLFAGGESGAATARSVEFDASSDLLKTTTSNSDFTMGQGDFTVECWVKVDSFSNQPGIFQISDTSGGLKTSNYSNTLSMVFLDDGSLGVFCNANAKWADKKLNTGQWYHVAFTRSSGTAYTFIDGELQITEDCSNANSNFDGTYIAIGGYYNTSYLLDGAISNFRVVKGTALYTSSFRPPTEPLTNITNTKLLCCNNSSTTGSTVTPETISTDGNPTASTDSPFDDPAAFAFGDSKEGIIKCGSYVGNGSSTGPEINLGWEPQWLLIKNTTASSREWKMLDSMRGLPTGSGDNVLIANGSETETGSLDNVDITPTGFKITANNAHYNENGETIIYCAIRRPDGYVGKPAEAGTDVFAMDTGSGSSTIPTMDSGFPVDFALLKKPASSGYWLAYARLMGQGNLEAHTDNDESGDTSNAVFDSNTGFIANSNVDSTYQSWMWKRGAGFDVVTYEGNGVSGHQISHSLNKTVEMMWVKSRDSSGNDADWQVYHKGLGQTDNDPEGWNLYLNTNQAENWNNFGRWNKTVPTSTHFTLGNYDGVNKAGDNFIAMLFASVDGISKIGYYSGSNSSQTISTGFAPRFLIMKKVDTAQGWVVLDTVRGWGSGGDERLEFHNTNAQNDSTDFGAPTSSGFTLVGNVEKSNQSGGSYIYYAHA